MTQPTGFLHATGQWAGSAEVYSGAGRFVGNGTDRRNVQPISPNRIRIDLSFIGPFKFSGHYFIEDHKTERLYQGPVNVGYAEPLGNALVDSNSYWAAIGLTQRFFLMILPGGQRQISLAQLSRGDQLIYSVVGENYKVDETLEGLPGLVNGTEYDFATDPSAGRGALFLHRAGTWRGALTVLDETLTEPLTEQAAAEYVETVRPAHNALEVSVSGVPFDPQPFTVNLTTNGYQAWSAPGDVVGAYNLCGGRALSGHFQHLRPALRVWRREVVAHEGDRKAVVHLWYRGGQRMGAQFGVLQFEPA